MLSPAAIADSRFAAARRLEVKQMRDAESRSTDRQVVFRSCLPLVFAASLATAATARAQAIPLRATDALVTDDGDLQYSLTNAASQPATAWSVTVTMTDSNG